MENRTASYPDFSFIDKSTTYKLIKDYGKNCLHEVIEPSLLKRFLSGEYLPQQNFILTNFIINSIFDEHYDKVGAILSLSDHINSHFFCMLAQNLLGYITQEASPLLIRTLSSVLQTISNVIPPEIADNTLIKYTAIAVPGLFSSGDNPTQSEKPSYKQDTHLDEKTNQAIEEALEGIFFLNDSCTKLLTYKYFNILLNGLKNDNLLFYRGTITCLIYKLVKNLSFGDLGFSFTDEVEKRGIIDFLMDDTLTFISDSYEKMMDQKIERWEPGMVLCGRVDFSIELLFRLKLIFYCLAKSVTIFDTGLKDKLTGFYRKISSQPWEFPKKIFFEILSKEARKGRGIENKIDPVAIQNYEYKEMLTTLKPSHLISREEKLNFYLWAFDRIKVFPWDKPNTKLFWDVMSSTKKNYIRKRAFREVEFRYKDINVVTMEILSALKSHSELFTKEKGERKVLLRNKVIALLDFYADFIIETKNHETSTFDLSEFNEDTTCINVSLNEATRRITFPARVETERFLDDVSVSFFGTKKSALHDLCKEDKLWVFTLGAGGEESRFIPCGIMNLRNTTDVSIQVPKDTEEILGKEIKDTKKEEMREDEDKIEEERKISITQKLPTGDHNSPMKVYSRKKEQKFNSPFNTDNIEDIFIEPPDEKDYLPFPFPTKELKEPKETKTGLILDFTKFLFRLLNTDHFKIEEEEKEDFTVAESIFRVLILLPHITMTVQTLSELACKDDAEPILFSKKYHKLCAETYILDRAQKLNLSGRTILEDIFGRNPEEADISTSVLTHIRYLQAKFFETLKDENKIYYRTTAKIIETILPLFTFTQERTGILFGHIQALLKNPDIEDPIKIEVAYAVSRMIVAQRNPDNNLVLLLSDVLQEKEFVVRGFSSKDRQAGTTLRKTLYTFFMDMRTKDRLAFGVALEKLISYARLIPKNCIDCSVSGEYFNFFNDVFTECGPELGTVLSEGMLQQVSNAMTKEKPQHDSIRNVMLKLFCTIVEIHPEALGNLKKKEDIAVALCSFNSYNPFARKAIRLVSAYCKEFKGTLTNYIRRYMLKYTLSPQYAAQFTPNKSLELCLLHILSGIPTIERALLDVNTDEYQNTYIQWIYELLMWFNKGNDKVTPRIARDIMNVLFAVNTKIKDLTPINAFSLVLESFFPLSNIELGVSPLKIKMVLNMGPDRAMPEVSSSGFGFLVPPKKTITDSLKFTTLFGDYSLGFEDRKMEFSDLPLVLIICVDYDKDSKSDIVPEFKETMTIKEIAPVIGGKDTLESDFSYTLCGAIMTSVANEKNEYLSYTKSKNKWLNVNKEVVSTEDLHDPSRKPLFLVYMRPFIASKDKPIAYGNETTETTLDENGFLSVIPCNTPRNRDLTSQIRDAEEGINLFGKPFSAERVHFVLQTTEISDWPEEVIKYVSCATYANDKSIDAEIEEHMKAISQLVQHSSPWRKGFIANFERDSLFSLWNKCKNKKILDRITELYATSFLLEGLDKSVLSEKYLGKLVNFCAYNKNCYYCLKILQDIGKRSNTMDMLCDSSISNVMSFLIKGGGEEDNSNPDKSVVKEASKILSHSIYQTLKWRKEGLKEDQRGLLTQKELNELLFQGNLLKKVLEECEQQEGESIVELLSQNDTEMLVPLARAVLEVLGTSKDVDEDKKAFSYIKAYLQPEDKLSLTRKRLIISPHTFPPYGVLSVHHRSREMSLSRLSLYIDFMMGLGPSKVKLLSRWRQDIAAFEDLLVQKLEVIIDKDVVFEAFARSELNYGVPKGKSKYWNGGKTLNKTLNKNDSDLLKRPLLFKNEISNHVLLQVAKGPTTESMKENTFLKAILAAHAVCTDRAEGEFANTTEGAIAIEDVLANNQKPETKVKQEPKKSVNFRLSDKIFKPYIFIPIEEDD